MRLFRRVFATSTARISRAFQALRDAIHFGHIASRRRISYAQLFTSQGLRAVPSGRARHAPESLAARYAPARRADVALRGGFR